MSHGPARIAFLLHGQHYGGLENRVVLLASRLDRRRFEPHVVCLATGRLWERLGAAGVARHLVPMAHRFDVTAAGRLARALGQIRPALIQSHSVRTNLLARYCATRLGVPHVANLGAPYRRDTNQTLQPKRLNAWLERLTARATDCFVTVNRAMARELMDQGISADRVTVIVNGVELQEAPGAHAVSGWRRRLEVPQDAPVIGFVGAMRPRKGLEVLLHALQAVAQERPDVVCVCVGSPEFAGRAYRDGLQRLGRDLGIAQRLRWVEFQDDVRPVMGLMDIVVLPSLFGEGCPSILLEAWTLERAVVGTRTEGIEELIEDGRTGRLVPPGDPTALARCLAQLLDEPAARRQLGSAGYALVASRFQADQMVGAYEALYAKLIGRRPQRA